MTTLLVDIGNTRIKWARLARGRLGRQQAAAHAGWKAEDFRGALAQSLRGVTAVLVVSVAGARVDRAFLRAVTAVAAHVRPRFVVSTRRAGGVINGYREVWRLGADRWVAAIGGHAFPERRGRPVCVVDVGTATTLDLVDAGGRHRGGAILPGPALMVSSLLRGTGGIRRRAGGAGRRNAPSLFARSTREALEAGAGHAVAALVERARAEARRATGRTPLVLLTGGGADAVVPYLTGPHTVIQDLVLRGLAALAAPLP
jgi:type III pantothenate kinase